MTDNAASVVPKGWREAHIKDLLGDELPLALGISSMTVGEVFDSTVYYREKLERDELPLSHATVKSAACAVSTLREMRREVVKQVIKRADVNSARTTLNGTTSDAIEEALRRVVSEIAREATQGLTMKSIEGVTKEIIEEATQELMERGVEVGTRLAFQQTGKGVAQEVTQQVTSRMTQAKLSTGSAMGAGLLIDGCLLIYSIGAKYQEFSNGSVSRREFCRHAIKRSSAAAGSIGIGAIGTFVGTLIRPGVGTFVGGVVGGLLGEMGGAKIGDTIDDIVGDSFN